MFWMPTVNVNAMLPISVSLLTQLSHGQPLESTEASMDSTVHYHWYMPALAQLTFVGLFGAYTILPIPYPWHRRGLWK